MWSVDKSLQNSTQDSCLPTKFSNSCVVCGDLSSGYHYEVSSCNGCKTFFRRTLIDKRVYKCLKNGKCEFNKDMRCACRACRFAKCLAVGMNPNAIQCNRTSRLASPSKSDLSDSSAVHQLKFSTTSAPSNNHYSTEQGTSRSSGQSSPESDFGNAKRGYTVSDLLDLPQNQVTSAMTGNLREALEYVSFSHDSNSDGTEKELSEDSKRLIMRHISLQRKIDELMNSNYDFCDSVLDLLAKPTVLEDAFVLNVQNIEIDISLERKINRYVALFIEYAKTYKVFKWISLKAKLYLLRNTAFIIVLFEMAYGVYSKRFPYESISDLDKSSTSNPLMTVIECISREKIDENEFILLKAIFFLQAECLGPLREEFDEIVNARQEVLSTLFDYVSCVSGSKKCSSRFGYLLSISWTLNTVFKKYKDDLSKMQLHALTREMMSSLIPTCLF